jgi:hypothetical protein
MRARGAQATVTLPSGSRLADIRYASGAGVEQGIYRVE